MSVRNLGALFQPRSVALIGASTKLASVGGVLTRNLLRAGALLQKWLQRIAGNMRRWYRRATVLHVAARCHVAEFEFRRRWSILDVSRMQDQGLTTTSARLR
jgi:uncharacterized protein (UPF0218 family)